MRIWKVMSLSATHTCMEDEWDEKTLRWIQLWRCSINFPWYEVRELDWGPWASSGGSLERLSTYTDTNITWKRNQDKKYCCIHYFSNNFYICLIIQAFYPFEIYLWEFFTFGIWNKRHVHLIFMYIKIYILIRNFKSCLGNVLFYCRNKVLKHSIANNVSTPKKTDGVKLGRMGKLCQLNLSNSIEMPKQENLIAANNVKTLAAYSS